MSKSIARIFKSVSNSIRRLMSEITFAEVEFVHGASLVYHHFIVS